TTPTRADVWRAPSASSVAGSAGGDRKVEQTAEVFELAGWDVGPVAHLVEDPGGVGLDGLGRLGEEPDEAARLLLALRARHRGGQPAGHGQQAAVELDEAGDRRADVTAPARRRLDPVVDRHDGLPLDVRQDLLLIHTARVHDPVAGRGPHRLERADRAPAVVDAEPGGRTPDLVAGELERARDV